ncbi:hypothetical protein C498_17278 [Haloferax volcanii DS2]|uniref:Uncharacterized protein n=1 Tax=Haloferax volcanii (strain ATCC 29605 / DSM 3757 / JCM 8879 / NBRC 14742 / NCIMB 2012 / VKM B-1768 / DS2) TaxID=309800 RepID=A0A384KH70_HALVD|nr:hypothetical protein C498_17278 [Haloferax volcanii DS2]
MPTTFVRASTLYNVESRAVVRHPAFDATDEDVRRSIGGDAS